MKHWSSNKKYSSRNNKKFKFRAIQKYKNS
jgi:hypothetical protein